MKKILYGKGGPGVIRVPLFHTRGVFLGSGCHLVERVSGVGVLSHETSATQPLTSVSETAAVERVDLNTSNNSGVLSILGALQKVKGGDAHDSGESGEVSSRGVSVNAGNHKGLSKTVNVSQRVHGFFFLIKAQE